MADRFLRSGNPGLNDKTFASQPLVGSGERMTVQGAINKSFLLLVVLPSGPGRNTWPLAMPRRSCRRCGSASSVGSLRR
jgi:hypothetical protein